MQEQTKRLQQSMAEMCKLKNRFSEKTCVIIGNGPSVRIQDLELLKNAYTFAVNKIYDIYPSTSWRPTFYVIQDYKLMKAIYAEVLQNTEESQYRFFNARILNQDQSTRITAYNDYYFKLINEWAQDSHANIPSFSDDFSSCAYEGYTVIYTVIQLAVYLGFSKIFLYGIDHNYSVKSSMNHTIAGTIVSDYFLGYRPVENMILNAPRLDRAERAYKAAFEYCEQHQIKVYNATRGGLLEVFPRRSLAQAVEVLKE